MALDVVFGKDEYPINLCLERYTRTRPETEVVFQLIETQMRVNQRAWISIPIEIIFPIKFFWIACTCSALSVYLFAASLK